MREQIIPVTLDTLYVQVILFKKNTCDTVAMCLKLTLHMGSKWGLNDIDSNISFSNGGGVPETAPRAPTATWRCLFNFAKDGIRWAV